MDLEKILKKCPKGTQLYSTLWGNVTFQRIDNHILSPIIVRDSEGLTQYFHNNGKPFGYDYAECMLFPSKDNRDWNTFVASKPKEEHHFKPFEKVLVRNADNLIWKCDLFSYKSSAKYVCVSSDWTYCIPYEGNEELNGTTKNPVIK